MFGEFSAPVRLIQSARTDDPISSGYGTRIMLINIRIEAIIAKDYQWLPVIPRGICENTQLSRKKNVALILCG
jgi:hypothetical protein